MGRWTTGVAISLVVGATLAACDDEGGSGAPATGLISTAPAPGEMCGDDQSPVVAAYEIENGDLRWVACGQFEGVRRSILEVSDDVVWLEVAALDDRQVVGRSATDGTARDPGSDAPTLPTRTGPAPWPVIDGIRIVSPQDGPTSAIDDTGATLWTQPGASVYDDVVAAGDGAVYVIDRQTSFRTVIAYEVASGDVRWTRDLGDDNYAAPWHVADERMFAIWDDLVVLSTVDGSVLWRTDHPPVEFPRMTDVVAVGDLVFVAFSEVASGGD
jgi:hypothetical protein